MSWYRPFLFLLAIVGWAEATESAHEIQGDRSMRAEHYGEAAAHYQRAVDQNANSAVLYRKLAEAHAKNEALPAAVRAYEQAIALAPSHAKTRFPCDRGRRCCRRGAWCHRRRDRPGRR